MPIIQDCHALLLQLFPGYGGWIAHGTFFLLTLSVYQAASLWLIQRGHRHAHGDALNSAGRTSLWQLAAAQPGAWPLACLRWIPVVGEIAMWHLGAGPASPWTLRAVAAITATWIAWSWTAAMVAGFDAQETWQVIALNGTVGGMSLRWLLPEFQRWMARWGASPSEDTTQEPPQG
ncbi:hypothetical protein [Roseateles sp. BYS87W]|uniref:Uncharacterized protein n=1 Tax=Pelomonas baiyunensis TaxID=3299026 RepID=A0ABW7H2Q7_9BURK